MDVPDGEPGAQRSWIASDPGDPARVRGKSNQAVDPKSQALRPRSLRAQKLFECATPITVTLHAGETLYLPSMWFV